MHNHVVYNALDDLITAILHGFGREEMKLCRYFTLRRLLKLNWMEMLLVLRLPTHQGFISE